MNTTITRHENFRHDPRLSAKGIATCEAIVASGPAGVVQSDFGNGVVVEFVWANDQLLGTVVLDEGHCPVCNDNIGVCPADEFLSSTFDDLGWGGE